MESPACCFISIWSFPFSLIACSVDQNVTKLRIYVDCGVLMSYSSNLLVTTIQVTKMKLYMISEYTRVGDILTYYRVLNCLFFSIVNVVTHRSSFNPHQFSPSARVTSSCTAVSFPFMFPHLPRHRHHAATPARNSGARSATHFDHAKMQAKLEAHFHTCLCMQSVFLSSLHSTSIPPHIKVAARQWCCNR